MSDLYQDLGVQRNADKDTIRKAYRKKAQKLHPDKPTGDAEKFHQITRAYDVLTDDKRRAHYDAHGVDGQVDTRGVMMAKLAGIFMSFVEKAEHANIIDLTRQRLFDDRVRGGQANTQNEKTIARYERIKKRLKKKGKGEDYLGLMLDGQISMLRRAIEMNKQEIENIGEMLKMLEDYEYSMDLNTYDGRMLLDLAGMADRAVFR